MKTVILTASAAAGLFCLLIGCKPTPDMPSFNLLLSDSVSTLNTKDIPDGRTSVLVFFSPDCEHCQEETADIISKIDSLKNVGLYFITIDPMDRLRVFNGYYKMKKYPNITTAQDYTYAMLKHYSGITPPSSIIYDKHKRLRAVFKGQASARQLIDFIQKM